ncbi:hypothetical protein Hs30E_05060 [Lactococcus hodotermopsidis]|uniref:Uncharacterized protein n=1 Tax=Pseudolactococcus hodotermopsidis TaxID=2709157 RepID=A0A6A0BBC7_9LACT|nr:hypothetical protein [Lactococcus hodotermopsidis]GFH41955.1 hypothetical protein Hs30E_05060 [Lactococcus hodotermopsidis]
MNLKNDMNKKLQNRKILNINDDFGIEKSWEEMVELLSQNEDSTINYLESVEKEDLYYISEIFEDLSEIFQSPKFISCLRKLDEKFPKLEMTNDIDIAESYIEK